ncbi:hypothetical protein EGW08_015034 [Elysia chlorotica]|uniref:RCC1-like domain-containing protein n=1 Tax=Elysia chlorotica TaxID=188477 RepID=A0A3S1B7Y1_ELYCH|nr:hypothetical protein EGW08_015034 [Elysia chlorotica]
MIKLRHLATLAIDACKQCGSVHASRPAVTVLSQSRSFFTGTCLTNWKKKHAKREAKKAEVHKYVGDNADRTTIVYAWGAADSGALGIPSYLRPNLKNLQRQFLITMINRPARVRFYDKQKMKALKVACGHGFTITSVKFQNKKFLLGCGINTDSQIGFHEAPKGSGRIMDQLIEPGRIRLPLQRPDHCSVVSMACGRAHSVVVVEDEGVFTLGNNAFGQCGRSIVEGEDYSKNPTINRVRELPDDVIKVVCGQDHTLFLTESGQVYSCGLGADGQTGSGHYKPVGHPVLVAGDIQGETIVSIGARADCSLAVSDKGDVFGWGNSEYGQLGLVTDLTQVNMAAHLPTSRCGRVVKAVAGGSLCALLNDAGQVFVWGFGILGKGPKLESTAEPSLIPEPIFGRNELNPDTRVVDIDCGLTYVAAINDQGDLYTWGKNSRGCLGLGEEKNQFFPWRVALPAQTVEFSCGSDHMAAICKSYT